MPHEIQFAEIPCGYATGNFRSGEAAEVIVREFTSSEDGNQFISRLEGLPRALMAKLPGARYTMESTVDHLFAIIRPDKSATLWINDLPHTLSGRVKQPVKAGDDVTLNHLLDITKINLDGIVVPPEAGLVVVLSAGWPRDCSSMWNP